MTTEIKKVAFALGIRPTNIDFVETLCNGVNIHFKNAQKVFSPQSGRQYKFAHHSQIAKYISIKFKDIKFNQEREML